MGNKIKVDSLIENLVVKEKDIDDIAMVRYSADIFPKQTTWTST